MQAKGNYSKNFSTADEPDQEAKEESWAGAPKYKYVSGTSKSPKREQYEAKFHKYKYNKD